MAPKGAKRATAAKAGGAQKKAKLSPEEEKLQRVVAVLQGAEQLPASCREMLVAMAAGSLQTLKDERHPCQERVVAMIGAILEEVRTAKDASVAAEAEKVKAAEEKLTQLQDAAAATDSELLAQVEASRAAEEKVAAAQAAVAEASDLCKATKESQQAAEEQQVAAKTESEAFDTALQEQFAVLLAGSWEDAQQAQGLLEKLAPFTAQLQLDDSLRQAFPAAGTKKPEERGSFDAVVLEQAEKAMAQRAEELRSKLAGCAPAVEEATAASQAAQEKLTQAEAAAAELASELQAAQTQQVERETACKAAAQEVKGFTKELKQIKKGLDAAQAELDLLQAPLDAFTNLSEKTAKVEAADADAEVPAAVPPVGGA